MIKVNLLPPELEPAPSELNPAIIVTPLVLVVSIALFVMYRQQASLLEEQRNEIRKAQNDIKQLEPIIAKVEELEKQKTELNKKKGVIQTLENERLTYPQFMEDLVRLLPSNIWLTNLATISQPNGTDLDVTLGVTALDNYAIADLISNLENSQIFSNIDLGAIATTPGAQAGAQSMAFQVKTTYKRMMAGAMNAVKKS